MLNSTSPINYRLGSLYSVITALLYATQEPFSFPAAMRLNTMQFVCLTQVALLVSIPLLTSRPTSRRDFFALLRAPSNYGYLAVIFAIGMSGLLLYNAGLSNAHPIIISAILNLSPFWAALVALLIARVPIPLSPAIFSSCFAGAFIGAMAVAWSQIGDANKPTISQLADNALHGSWVYAIPVPLCSALGGTLIGRWFAKYDEIGCDRGELPGRECTFDTRLRSHFILAKRASIRSAPGDRSDDCRDDRRRVGGPRVLSNRADRHGRRQRLRHDVLQSGPGAYGPDIADFIVVDRGFALCCGHDVLPWLGGHRGVAADIFAEVMERARSTILSKLRPRAAVGLVASERGAFIIGACWGRRRIVDGSTGGGVTRRIAISSG